MQIFSKRILMPPWWVYKNHGERSDHRQARFLCISPCKRFDCVGAVSDAFNHTVPLVAALGARLSGASYRTARRGRA